MIVFFAMCAVVFLMMFVGVGGSLYRIANAIEAQNKHYGLTGEKEDPR